MSDDVIKLIKKSLKKPARIHKENRRGWWTCRAKYHAVHKKRGLIAVALEVRTPSRVLDLHKGEFVRVELDRLNINIRVDHVSPPSIKANGLYEYFVIVEGRNPKRAVP